MNINVVVSQVALTTALVFGYDNMLVNTIMPAFSLSGVLINTITRTKNPLKNLASSFYVNTAPVNSTV